MIDRRRFALAGAASLAGCAIGPPPPLPSSPPPAAIDDAPPPAPREFRAAWIASVTHIDWPARAGQRPEAQRADATLLLDRAKALNLNALVLQVRPSADALYPSTLEPWSEWLTGRQGLAPDPPWDPLAFWVGEAHRRGLELHAWLNPYRARHSAARSPLAAPHIGLREPASIKRYGDQLWLDPAEPAASAQMLAVVADVVARYDIDGVHLDDYFYPYPVLATDGSEQPFPDAAAWLRYLQGGGNKPRADWRRAQVDGLVEALYRTVHSIKPRVRVGLSPFGIGRPDQRPPGIEGFSQYDKLYADVERWCREGWFDYLAPQLYWPRDRRAQAFEPLLDYWLTHNEKGRHIWPGLFTSAIAQPKEPWPASEIAEQIAAVRRRAGAGGHLHFSLSALAQDRGGIATLLRDGAYATPALAPATPWLDASAPAAPTLRALPDGALRIEPGAGKPAFVWALWRRVRGQWRFAVQPAEQMRAVRGDAPHDGPLFVSAVDRVGNESARVAI